jgi:hypothetical protein
LTDVVGYKQKREQAMSKSPSHVLKAIGINLLEMRGRYPSFFLTHRAARQPSVWRVFYYTTPVSILSIDKLYKDLREKYPEIGQKFFSKTA